MIKYISHGMQEIRVRLSVEAIFFAISISLLQFFKINLGKFGGIINISDCVESPTTI